MTLLALTFLGSAVTASLAMVILSMFLCFLRLIKGPTFPDRAVALDLIASLAVGVIAAYDIATEQPVLLDAAIVVALVAFLGTVAFALYLQRRGRDE